MDIVLSTYANGSTFIDKGSEIPVWASNTTTANSWALPNVDYGISKNGQDIYIQYGKNEYGWASIRYWNYKVNILSQTLRDDNSLDVTLRVIMNFWRSTEAPSRLDGYRVVYNIYINGTHMMNYTGRTIDDIRLDSDKYVDITVNVPPEQYSNSSAMHLTIEYPDGEYISTSSYIGVRLYNPNPLDPDIKPWAIRKSGVFRTLNVPSGTFKKRSSGSWVDKSIHKESSVNAINKGVARIRKSGSWRGQNKFGS